MSQLEVQILSPAKVVAKVAAKQVQVPGALGYMGILPGHAALIAELGVGVLTVEGDGGTSTNYFVAGGYVDVANDKVTVLVDVVEKVSDIDMARAEKAKLRATERLERRAADVDMARAQAALARATERLAIASRLKH